MSHGKVIDSDGAERDMGPLRLELTCACGREVLVFEHGIIHHMPMCADFETREPNEFLRWHRERKEKAQARKRGDS